MKIAQSRETLRSGTSNQISAHNQLQQSIEKAEKEIENSEEISDVAESGFDFEIHQSMDGVYKEEKLSLEILPTDLSRQIFDYEGILSSEFENYLAGLNPGGKYKVKVYTYNSQLEILKAIESIIPKNDEIIIFIQKKNDKALIKLSLGANVNADLLQNNITKEDIVSLLNEASPQSLKTTILFDEIKRNVNSYALVQEAEAYDGNIMALLAIKFLDWGVQGLESFKLEERYWNPHLSGYNPIFSNNHLENAFICGFYNGLINEAKAIPELASLLIKVSTSEENQKRMKEDINKLLEAGILNTLVEGFAKKYSGEPDAIVSYNVGKDVVFVATFFVSFTTVTKAGKITSIVKLVNPLEEALNLMKMVSRAGLSVTRTGQHVIIHIGNNVSRFIAKMDANSILREIKWIENGNTLEILENIKYIDDTGGESFGNLAIVKEGDDVGVKVAGEIDDILNLIKKWDNITIDEAKTLYNKINKTDIKSSLTKQWGAKTANNNFKLEYIADNIDVKLENYIPPYKANTFADQIKLAEDALFIRVHGTRGQVGRWMMTIEDYKQLLKSPEKFKESFALPSTPTKASLVKIPKGTTIWKGYASGNKWGAGGGVQIQVDNWGNIPFMEKTKWYKQLNDF